MMEIDTTPEKHQEYVKQREEFKKKKEELSKQIRDHQNQVNQLEGDILSSRPKTENGKKICGRCDTTSMAFVGRRPDGGWDGGELVYECEICNHQQNYIS